jgi:hypothetical protein
MKHWRVEAYVHTVIAADAVLTYIAIESMLRQVLTLA